MQVGDIMTRDVKTANPDDTFADAARLLHEHGISSVLVLEGRSPRGIVTERDLVNVVADGQDPARVRIADRMTTDLATVESSADITEAAALMGERRIRHLPVVDRGELAGIISIRDLTTWAIGEMTSGHELADMERSAAALSAVAEVKRAE